MYDEHYFLTDPKQFFIGHYPTEPKYMLLKNPPDIYMFGKLPWVHSHFYEFDLTNLSHTWLYNKTDSGYLMLVIKEGSQKVEFLTRLFHLKTERKSKMQHIPTR